MANDLNLNVEVMSKDEPYNLQPNKSAIIHSRSKHDSSEVGHWTCAIMTEDYIFYYDPFGVPMDDLIKKNLKKYKKVIIASTNEQQAYSEDSCGIYCINNVYTYFNNIPN